MSPTKKRNGDLTKANDDTEEEKKWLDREDEVNTHRSGYCKILELFKMHLLKKGDESIMIQNIVVCLVMQNKPSQLGWTTTRVMEAHAK